MTKSLWLEKNGFNPIGRTYVIVGDDTYSIKDELKKQGYKYHPWLKWHAAEMIELPVGYGHICFEFDELCTYDEVKKEVWFKEDAEMVIQKRLRAAEGPSLSEYVGEIGERLRNLTAIFKSVRGFNGHYGWTNIYTFEVGNDVLVWFTTKDLNLEKGCIVDLTGTVKKHEEFREVKTTQLSRCIIKEVK